MSITFIPIKTGIAFAPKHDFYSLFSDANPEIHDGDIVFITSKILAIHQGRCIKISPDVKKEDLIRQEADKIVAHHPIHGHFLTLKDGIFVGSAGIDESNGNGYYIMWPNNLISLLSEIHEFITKKYEITNLGVVTTDSVVLPMRKGTVGRSIASVGFNPNIDCIQKPDIFGHKMQVTTINITDNLAGAAVFLMGETNECQPMVIARGAENIEFGKNFNSDLLKIKKDDDLFSCLI